LRHTIATSRRPPAYPAKHPHHRNIHLGQPQQRSNCAAARLGRFKRAYEAPGTDPIRVVAAHNITAPTLRRYARDKDWVRSVVSPPPPAGGRATGSPTRVSIRPGALIRRLRTVVTLKLEHLEMDIPANPTLSPTDHERHSRAIGTLVKTAEIVDDTSRGDTGNASTGRSPGRTPTGKPASAPETAGNGEAKLRRELAARIKHLRERLNR
jgi:hypothetical protein